MDELFDRGAAVPGCAQADRKKLYQELQTYIADDQPYVFLWSNESLLAVNNRIVVNPPTKLGVSYEIWKWYSKTGQ